MENDNPIQVEVRRTRYNHVLNKEGVTFHKETNYSIGGDYIYNPNINMDHFSVNDNKA